MNPFSLEKSTNLIWNNNEIIYQIKNVMFNVNNFNLNNIVILIKND